jgi:hypothetical protein
MKVAHVHHSARITMTPKEERMLIDKCNGEPVTTTKRAICNKNPMTSLRNRNSMTMENVNVSTRDLDDNTAFKMCNKARNFLEEVVAKCVGG